MVRGGDGAALKADIYLFDTLSGGAGYADQAGQPGTLEKILDKTLDLLEHCKSNCDRSCYNCLRHYGNQYWHERLDRHLAAVLVRYMRYGELPAAEDLRVQARKLHALQRMFELDGYTCHTDASMHGVDIPLLITDGTRRVAVGTYPSLLNRNADTFDHPLYTLDGRDDVAVGLLNEYLLDRNLPAAYQQVNAEFTVVHPSVLLSP